MSIKSIWLLTVFQLKARNPHLFNRKKLIIFCSLSAVGVVVLFGLLSVLIDRIMVSFLLTVVDDEVIFPLVLTFILALFGLIWMLLSVASLVQKLYYNRDIKLYASMPLKNSEIYISKLLSIYIEELITSSLFILPTLFAFGFNAGYGISFFILCVPVAALIVLLAFGAASVFAVPVVYLIRFFKSKAIASFVVTVVLVIGAFSAYMYALFNLGDFLLIEQTTVVVENIQNALQDVSDFTFIFARLANILLVNQVSVSVLTVVGAVAALTVLSVMISMGLMKNGAGEIIERSPQRGTRSLKIGGKGIFRASIKADLIQLIRNPGQIVAMFLFCIVMPVFLYTLNTLLFTINLGGIGLNMVVGANILTLGLLTLMSCTYSGTAVTREGSMFYLQKIAPSDFRRRMLPKIALNVSVIVIFALAGCIVIAAFGFISVLNALLLFIFCVLLAVGHSTASLLKDIAAPALDWYDVSEVADKPGGNAAKSLFHGIILGCILGIFAILVSGVSLVLCWIVVLAAALLYAAWAVYKYKIAVKYFHRRIEP